MHNVQQINEARDFLMRKTDYRPMIGMILGSGLGTLADEIESPFTI
ncbi:hypothetical protein [Paenibacillus guangzhouensis]